MNTILRFLLLLPLAAFGQPAAPLKSVATVADLTNRFPVPGEYVQVQGYRTNGDWGDGRTMRHNPTSTNAVDNGCVFSVATGEGRWEAPDCEGGHVNVRYFDARGDGVTDDTAAFQAAFDAIPMPATNTFYEARGGAVFIPNGVYVVSAPLRMRPKSVEGSSRFGTVILNRGTTNDVFTAMTPAGTPPTGIWLYRVAHLSIHQAEDVSPTAGAGIRVQSDDGFTASMVDVEDVFMHRLYRGFHGSALQGSSFKDVTVYASREDGILWDVYQTMVHASGCWTYYCGQDGTGHGWHLQGPAYCTVTASGADSNYGWGWYIESGTVQAPRGNNFTVGAEQNRDGGILIKNAIGGVYSPMVVTPDDLPTAADGIVVDNGRMVGLVGAFTQQGAIGGTGYPLRITNGVPDYPSVTVNASYLNSYNTGSEYHQTIGIGTYLPWEERGFIGLNTDGKPRRMLDVHDRTGAAGNATGHELARLALHTADTNGNAYISLTPDGEKTFHRIIANNLSTNTVFNYGTNGDTVFLGPSAPLGGDNGSFLFQLGTTPVMSIKGGDTLGGVGIGTTRPNPAALLDIRSSTRGLLLPSWTSTEYTGGLYGSGIFTPPGLLSYDSTYRRVRVQTRNATDGLTNNQYTTLFGYVDRDLRLGTAHRQIGKIWPQSVHATDTNIGSVYIYFTAEDVVGLEIEQNSLRAGPYQYGTFGDTIIRNSYSNSAGAYGNLLLMAGTHAGVIVSNGTHRGSVSIRSNLFVTGDLVRSNGMTLTGSLDSKADTNHTQSYTTITGLGSLATVNDAASDGTTYGRQNGAWAPVSSGLSDAPSNGSPHGREDGAWVIVAEAAHTHAYLPLAATTNSPLTGDLLLKKTLPSLFFSDDSSSLGGGIAFGVGGFVIGPVAYGNPDYIGTPWIEISTNGALTVLDDVLSSGDGTFSGTVSGTMLEGERLELDTASNTNAPAAGKVAIFLRQVGGDGQLVARFPTGADHVLAPTTSTFSTVLGNTDAVTVPDTESAETTLIGTIRSGESATFGAGTIATGSIIKVEAMGTVTAAGNWADGVLRVKFGSSRTLAFTVLEEDSHVATDYTWRLTAYLSVTTAGATATTVLSGMLEYEYPNDADTPGVRRLRHLSGTASGTLDTTGSNVFDLTWDNATGLEVDWTCNHLLVTRY